MILEYKEGYNWCSFNIDAVKLSTLFENIEKPINLYPNRDDSGLVVYTQKEAIIWQLENETVFGKLNASWSNDITLTHSEMYIIHFPKNTLLEISNDFIPEYLPITISKNIHQVRASPGPPSHQQATGTTSGLTRDSPSGIFARDRASHQTSGAPRV